MIAANWTGQETRDCAGFVSAGAKVMGEQSMPPVMKDVD
jgi:hypothetical protein